VADVVVVGAGPAGATAATVLARAGRSVVVVDKAVFPRDKCCGDGLTTLALRELEQLGLEPKVIPNWKTVDARLRRRPAEKSARHCRQTGSSPHHTAPQGSMPRHRHRPRGRRPCSGGTFEGSVGSESVRSTSPTMARSRRYVIAADGM
jgi:2-polyprenyl-6-methoxyphenol hydroxylase-like FAD-dependent oxidoreductase